MITRLLGLFIAGFLLLNGEVFAASGCNYPTTLDSYSNKVTGDFLTTADINSRSCAIEQLEIALNKIIGGASGGVINIVHTTPNLVNVQVNGGVTGPAISLYHNNTTADIGTLNFYINDTSTTQRRSNYIQASYLDGTTTSQDSQLNFCVMNNVNAANCNTVASLSSLGVWTDASSAAHKDYEGDIGALDKLKQLTTIGVYRAKGLPQDKIEKAERHYSPTAEDFHQVFGFGNDTTIAPKDAAWIAAKAVLELEARVAALEKMAP